VIRKKADGKSKGYGFVSFADPHDFLKAWKEMDGKYIGSRPCRLKKASEDVAPTTIGVRKDRLLAANNKFDEFKSKNKMGGAIGGELRRHGVGKAWKEK
jgi:RNA recognition motif-containing protein